MLPGTSVQSCMWVNFPVRILGVWATEAWAVGLVRGIVRSIIE